ncbi:Cation-independent mannose-6-phosphate receptor CI-MPR [Agyrium rufum]|nr:Cation-independent mannose-6-phosphate receptor CI-MPR [Agyrium rufum]
MRCLKSESAPSRSTSNYTPSSSTSTSSLITTFFALSALLSISSIPSAAFAADIPAEVKPCTITSALTGSFFDLNPISVIPIDADSKPKKNQREESWHARGYDYGANFTVNFCRPVVEELKGVVGVEENRWMNISAYYTRGGKTYSIGYASAVQCSAGSGKTNLVMRRKKPYSWKDDQIKGGETTANRIAIHSQESSSLVFRGRKLVLNYTDGSPCPSASSSTLLPRSRDDDKDDLITHPGDDDKKGKHDKGDDDGKHRDEDVDKPKKSRPSDDTTVRRKSTIISLLCDRDPLAEVPNVAFIGASPDECTYFFEARSAAACGGVAATPQAVGPGSVFSIIFVVAAAVYVLGGIAYQRTVMHQRGWRQLPNYAIWAGIFNFFKDMFIILTSSCTRCFRARSGYNQLPTHNGVNGYRNGSRSGGSGRDRNAEDENRLIDNLDEEWDD